MTPVIATETLIVKSANGEDFTVDLNKVSNSVFAKELDFSRLKCHLAMLNGNIHQALPEVKRVTNVRTMCSSTHRSTLSEVHKLVRLYRTVPITSVTSESRAAMKVES